MAGIALTDRKLGAEVRRLGLKKLKVILEDDNHEKYTKEFQEAVFLRLAANLLPRINEHSGVDGKDLFPNPLLNGKSNVNPNNDSTEQTTEPEEEN